MDLSAAITQHLYLIPPAQQQEAEAQHQAFLERFPVSVWDHMAMDEYALGTQNTKDSYSYALEWGTTRLGSIRGGTSAKHVIFQRRKDGSWHYPGGYGSAEEAWGALRDGYRQALTFAADGQWGRITEIAALDRPRVTKLKTLFLYHPHDVLPVYSSPHLRHFAQQLGAPTHDDLLELNRGLLEHLRGMPELREIPGLGLAHMLYGWSPPPGWDNPVWLKVAPGAQASKWLECHEGSYMCVGWDDVGDLSLFETEEDFKAAFAEVYPYNGHASTVSKKAAELWRFGQLRAGDRVVANKGTAEVVGIGTVLEKAYEWNPDRDDYRHCVAVEWDTTLAQLLDPPVKQWATTTVLQVKGPLQERLLGQNSPGPLARPIALHAEPQFLEWERTLRRKGQLVFYGPPGTGKTRAARAFARWWLAKELELDLTEFEHLDQVDQHLQYRGECRNAWVWHMPVDTEWDKSSPTPTLTAPNPSLHSGDLVMCWREDRQRFVGLARLVEVHDDVDLRLLPLQRLDGPDADAVASDALLRRCEALRPAAPSLTRVSYEEASRLLELWQLPQTLLAPEPEDLASYLTQVTFHASYSYEDFLEGYRPAPGTDEGLQLRLRDGLMMRLARTAAADGKAPYLLLIDEMNRANTPRVFGELMTVLEYDKRGMAVTLPSSGRDLVLPPNIFIIGTMNTADRSIRTLDAALRRRFAFVEILPDSTPLGGAVVEDLELDSFLDGLNQRILRAVGREKQVGQSYLLHDDKPVQDVESFAEVMRLEIIPLLQEMAYDDYGLLETFLGKDVVDRENQRLRTIVTEPSALVGALVKEFQRQSTSATP